MHEFADKLPDALKALLAGSAVEQRPDGRLGTRMYRAALPGGQGAYLKVASLASDEDLAGEWRRLVWLQNRLPAPTPLHYSEQNGYAYLLISELQGEPGYHPSLRTDPGRLMVLMAQGLQRMHAIPIHECPFQATPPQDLEQIEHRMRRGMVDRQAFMAANNGMTPEQAYDELAATGHLVHDLVFTHGDYYMPNVMVQDWNITGFVDLALAGVADRYRDLTAMVDSIQMNYGPAWVPAFVHAYGLVELDPAKARYYTLLDQFYTDFSAPEDVSPAGDA